MQVNSASYYFIALTVMILAGGMLNEILPLHKSIGQKETAAGRIQSLDGLRGILAVSVFFHHSVLLHYFLESGSYSTSRLSPFYAQMGYLPVCMFFFITVYLFWLKLMKQPSLPVFPFLYGRLARLGFAYWTACVAFFLLVLYLGGFQLNESLPKLLIQAVGWLAFIGGGHDLNRIAGSKQWLGQVWTLQAEWYFYLTLPFLGWFARKRFRLPLLLAGAAFFAFLFNLAPTHGLMQAWFKNVLTGDLKFLAYTFSVGMIVSVIPFSKLMLKAIVSKPGAALSLALMAIVLFFLTPSYGGIESVLLFVPFACISQGNTIFGLLVSASVRFLGRISYSFYLLHSLVLTIGAHILVRHFSIETVSAPAYWSFTCICGLVALILAAFSYQYLERPFLHVGRSLPSASTRHAEPSATSPEAEVVSFDGPTYPGTLPSETQFAGLSSQPPSSRPANG